MGFGNGNKKKVPNSKKKKVAQTKKDRSSNQNNASRASPPAPQQKQKPAPPPPPPQEEVKEVVNKEPSVAVSPPAPAPPSSTEGPSSSPPQSAQTKNETAPVPTNEAKETSASKPDNIPDPNAASTKKPKPKKSFLSKFNPFKKKKKSTTETTTVPTSPDVPKGEINETNDNSSKDTRSQTPTTTTEQVPTPSPSSPIETTNEEALISTNEPEETGVVSKPDAVVSKFNSSKNENNNQAATAATTNAIGKPGKLDMNKFPSFSETSNNNVNSNKSAMNKLPSWKERSSDNDKNKIEPKPSPTLNAGNNSSTFGNKPGKLNMNKFASFRESSNKDDSNKTAPKPTPALNDSNGSISTGNKPGKLNMNQFPSWEEESNDNNNSKSAPKPSPAFNDSNGSISTGNKPGKLNMNKFPSWKQETNDNNNNKSAPKPSPAFNASNSNTSNKPGKINMNRFSTLNIPGSGGGGGAPAPSTSQPPVGNKPGKINMNKFSTLNIPGSGGGGAPAPSPSPPPAGNKPGKINMNRFSTLNIPGSGGGGATAPSPSPPPAAGNKPGKINMNRFSTLNIPGSGGGSAPPPPPGATGNTSSKPSPPVAIARGGNSNNDARPGKININKFATLNIPGMGGGGGGGGRGPINTKEKVVATGKRPGKIDVFASARKIKDAENQGQADQSEKAKRTMLAPVTSDDEDEDWDYLYELAAAYDKYKAEEAAEKKTNSRPKSNASPAAASTAPASTKPKDVKNKLNNLFGGPGGPGGGVNMSADGKFLNDKYFDKYLKDKPSGLALNFTNETGLFKRFRTKGEQVSISQQFAIALIKHPRSKNITQLNMNGSLLPDPFLKALCDTCREQKGLPMLQVLNLESNDFGRDGMEPLSKIIADKRAWRRLQILKLENQKRELAQDAEEHLGDAAVLSQSLVVIGLDVKGGVPKQQCDNTVRMNMDLLRRARRKNAKKKGTLKARKRNEMEKYFDSIANSSDRNVKEVDLTGNLKFLGLDSTERTKTGSAFLTNTTVKKITMTKLKLDDDWAEAFGASLVKNTTLESVVLDSNSFSGKGMLYIFEGLGKNKTINNFQLRHQSKKMSSADEEKLPDILQNNTALLKLGTDVRNPLIKTKLERKLNQNRDVQRKQRAAANKK